MLKKLSIIILMIAISTFTAPSQVESYSGEKFIPQEAFKASGASFNETKMVLWKKYANKQEALRLREEWQRLLSQNGSGYTGKIIIQPETHYIIADLKSNRFNTDFQSLAKIIPPKTYQSTSQFKSIIYKGSFGGQIDRLAREEIIAKIVQLTKARPIDYYGDSRNYYWSGYTPLIKDTVTGDCIKTNLNIALRYSAIDDITYIFIGTPIITMEY